MATVEPVASNVPKSRSLTSDATSDISQSSKAVPPTQNLINSFPQNLYATAQRFQQTNRSSLLKRLNATVKSRRIRIFLSILCIIILLICYSYILILMQDLHNNYNYNQPIFVLYISQTLYPIFIGLLLIKPIWYGANKYHKSLKDQKIIISKDNQKHYNILTSIYQQLSSQNNKKKQLSSHNSDINSTNSYYSNTVDTQPYDFDDLDDEYNDSILDDNIPKSIKSIKHQDSMTELMLSEISFNHITENNYFNEQSEQFSHSKNSNNNNGLLHPYFPSSHSTNKSNVFTNNTKMKYKTLTPTSVHRGLKQQHSKSECGPTLDDLDENRSPLMDKQSYGRDLMHQSLFSGLSGLSNNTRTFNQQNKEKKSISKQIVVSSRRDISQIPQSVFFTFDLPLRSIKFYYKSIGWARFVILFILTSISSILWISSIQNGINLDNNYFLIQINSVFSLRVIFIYLISIIFLQNFNSQIINYKTLNLINCQNIFCLLLVLSGIICVLSHFNDIFSEFNYSRIILMFLSPFLNGLLMLFYQNLSQYVYIKNLFMGLGDILYILSLNGLIILLLLWPLLLILHLTHIETFSNPFTSSFAGDICWRICVISVLQWIYNISLFCGITLINSVWLALGFTLIIPINFIFNTDLQLFKIVQKNEIIPICGVFLIIFAFLIYELQFYIWYVLYCGSCAVSLSKCRNNTLRYIHKKTRFKLYGKCQCCCKYRCCCC